MRSFLVEAYTPEDRSLGELELQARAAVHDLNRAGTQIRYVRSILIHQDETCFHLFEAPSADAVQLASERAGFAAIRVVETAATDEAEHAPSG